MNVSLTLKEKEVEFWAWSSPADAEGLFRDLCGQDWRDYSFYASLYIGKSPEDPNIQKYFVLSVMAGDFRISMSRRGTTWVVPQYDKDSQEVLFVRRRQERYARIKNECETAFNSGEKGLPNPRVAKFLIEGVNCMKFAVEDRKKPAKNL